MIPEEALQAVEGADASADVAWAFANKDAAKRALVARALGVEPEVAAHLGYGRAEA